MWTMEVTLILEPGTRTAWKLAQVVERRQYNSTQYARHPKTPLRARILVVSHFLRLACIQACVTNVSYYQHHERDYGIRGRQAQGLTRF